MSQSSEDPIESFSDMSQSQRRPPLVKKRKASEFLMEDGELPEDHDHNDHHHHSPLVEKKRKRTVEKRKQPKVEKTTKSESQATKSHVPTPPPSHRVSRIFSRPRRIKPLSVVKVGDT